MMLDTLRGRDPELLRIEISGLEGHELQAKTKHNETVSRIESSISAHVARLDAAFTDCLNLKIAQIRKARDDQQQRLLELLQERARLAEERLAILDTFETHFQKAIDTAEKELETASKKAVKQLHNAGISAESNPVAKHDAGAAEIQFGHQVSKSSYVREAKANLRSAEDAMARLNTLRIQSDLPMKETLDQLKAFVHELLR